MKKVLNFILVLSLIFICASCGDKNNTANDKEKQNVKDNGVTLLSEGNRTMKLFNEVLNQKDKPIFMKFEMNEDVTGNGPETVIMSYAVDGENIYTNIEASVSVGTISKGQEIYTIMHNDKMYMKSSDISYSDDLKIFDEDMTEIDESMFTTGTKEIDGVNYEYEEISDGVDSTRFYYDNTDRLVYLEAGNDTIKVLDYNNNVPKSLFEIPAGYTEITLPSEY